MQRVYRYYRVYCRVLSKIGNSFSPKISHYFAFVEKNSKYFQAKNFAKLSHIVFPSEISHIFPFLSHCKINILKNCEIPREIRKIRKENARKNVYSVYSVYSVQTITCQQLKPWNRLNNSRLFYLKIQTENVVLLL